jgi:hypothetical protein
MNVLILYLRAMMRELDMSLLKAQIFAGDIIQVLRTLRFEPADWTDIDTFGRNWAISTTKEGYLRVFTDTTREYADISRLRTDEVLRFTSRLLYLIEAGYLKLKEEP